MPQFIFNETSLIQYLKMKGLIPLNWSFWSFKSIYHTDHFLSFIIQSRKDMEQIKEITIPLSDVAYFSVPKEIQVETSVLIRYVNSKKKHDLLPENAVVLLSTNEFSIIPERRDQIALSFYTPHLHDVNVYYIELSELMYLKMKN